MRLVFEAMQKVTAPMREVASGSHAMAQKLRGTRDELTRLQKAQSDIDAFRDLKTQVRDTARAMDAAERKVAALAREIKSAEAPTSKLNRAFAAAKKEAAALSARHERQTTDLKGLRDALDGAGISTHRLAEHQQRLRRDTARTSDEIEQQQKRIATMEDARTRSAITKERWKNGGQKAREIGETASIFASMPMGVMLAASAQAAMNAEELGSAYRITFRNAGEDMERWANQTSMTMGRSITEIKQGANSFGLFFNRAAKSEPEAAQMSKTMAILAQDMSSFFNVSGSEASSALFSGLSGESEPLRRFGVFLNEGAVASRALSMGLAKSKNEISDNDKILARYSLIMEATKNAQGDVARTSGSVANKLREAGARWQNVQVIIGEKLLPNLPPVIDAFVTLVTTFSKMSPEMQKFVTYAAAAGFIFGPMLIGAGALISSTSTIASAFVFLSKRFAIGASVAKFFTGTLVNVAKSAGFAAASYGRLAAGMAVSGMRLAAGALFSVGRAALWAGRAFLLNPIGLAITGIALGAFLIYKYWDKIVPFFQNLWAGALGIFQRAIGGIKTAFGALPAWMRTIGSNMMNGLLTFIRPGALVARLLDVARAGVTAFKNFFGIRSPSRIFMAMGGHMMDGLSLGIRAGEGGPLKRLSTLSDKMTRAVATGGIAAGLASAPPALAAPRGGDTISITINAGSSASAQDIAREVERVLRERDADRAAARRGSYEDRWS